MITDKLELDPRILQKNLEITKLTQQIDNSTSENVVLTDLNKGLEKQNKALKKVITAQRAKLKSSCK